MESKILKEVSKWIIPFIQIFGMYVIVNGHISPGGGFAGGTIIGSSFILYRMIKGSEQSEKKLKYTTLMKIMCFSLISYGIIKGYSFINGGLELHLPNLPLGTRGKIFSAGYVLPLNLFVGAIVAVTVYFLYSLFSEGEI